MAAALITLHFAFDAPNWRVHDPCLSVFVHGLMTSLARRFGGWMALIGAALLTLGPVGSLRASPQGTKRGDAEKTILRAIEILRSAGVIHISVPSRMRCIGEPWLICCPS